MANLTIQDVRSKYPDYDDLSDEELSDKLHTKFYSDLPRDEFNQKIGFKQEEPADDQSFLSKLPRNLVAGLVEGGRDILNIPHTLTSENPKQGTLAAEMGIKASDIPFIPDENIPKKLGLPENATLMDKIIRGFGQFAPATLLPEAELGEVGQAISKIPKAGEYIKKSLELGVPQAPYAAIQDPDHPLEGAATGLASGFVAPAIESGYNALRPSNIFKSKLTPEELEKNLEVTEGTNTGLGKVIESPSLVRLQENYLPHMIGSGAEATMQKTADQITEKGKNLLDKIQGALSPEDTSAQLQSAMKIAASEARKEKNANFEKLNNAADDAGLKIGRDTFKQTAQNALNDVKQSPELEAEFSPDLLKDLQRYASNDEGNNLKLTNIFRGKLGDKAQELYENGKMHEFGIVNSLKDSLSKDIESAFEASPNKDLKDLYAQTQKDYAEKFAPFEDKDIVRFTRQGGDPDLILPHFLRIGQNDRSYLLQKLTKNIGTREKEPIAPLISYAYLSKAVNQDGQINPLKLSALYQKLGSNQRVALMPDKDMRNEFENFSKLVGKNKEAFDLMRNPKTGARNTDLLIKMAEMMGGGAIGGIRVHWGFCAWYWTSFQRN